MKKLTEGSPIKLILSFAIPLLFGNIFQLFYNLADTRIVGETLGENALAALGATSAINTVIIGFLNGMTNGFSLLTARFFGAKDEKHMKQTVAATLVLGFATAALLTLLSLVFLEPLLKLLNTPDEIFSQAKTYISIILAGMAVTMCYNICASILRAVGDTITPLVFLIISTLVNIVLDLLFIKGFGSNVEGAAYATLISQLLSVILCIVYIFRKYPVLIPDKESFTFSAKLAGEMYAAGLSMGLMISLVGIGTVIIQGTINMFGTDIIVSHTASRKISDMFMMPISVFGMASATFAGQNYGAGKINRVKQGVYSATIITWVWSLIVIAIAYAFTPFLAHLITGIDNAEIINITRKYLWINTPFYFVLDIVIVFRNALQGIGDKVTPILSSIIELVGKFAVAMALAPKLGYLGVMISEPLVWIGMAIILAIGFYHKKVIRTGKIK